MKTPIITSCLAASAGAISVPVADKKPDGTHVVPKNFVGFGMEAAFFPHFGNEFSKNLVSSLASRMDAPPFIRVGGTSGDWFTYDASQKEPYKCVSDTGCGTHNAHYRLGPSYFEAFANFADADMFVQAPLPNPPDLDSTLAYVSSAWKKSGNGERVASIALGNEVEFIWDDPQSYADAAIVVQDAIVKNLSLSGDAANIFEIANSASGTVTGKGYHLPAVLKTGIADNGRSKIGAEHWYQISDSDSWSDEEMQSLYTLFMADTAVFLADTSSSNLGRMINHKAIVDRFQKYTPGLEAAESHGLDYDILEGAAVLGKGGPPPTFSSGFGYALWAVDFNLVCMSRGVKRVANLAGRPSASRVFWVPDDSSPSNPGPNARAPYPAAIMIADFIGKGHGSSVKEIDLGRDLLSAYAMYNEGSGDLERVALLNMRLYNGTQDKPRDRERFEIPVRDGIQQVTVRRLRADLGVAAMGFDYGGPENNVTWGGEQWSHGIDLGNGHFPTGDVVENTIEVKDGIAAVVIPDSEAVIMYIR